MLTSITEAEVAVVENFRSAMAGRLAQYAYARAVLDDDDAATGWVRECLSVPRDASTPAWCRADAYGSRPVRPSQELPVPCSVNPYLSGVPVDVPEWLEEWYYFRLPRRPVLLFGSRRRLQTALARGPFCRRAWDRVSDNGYAGKVFSRWLRRARLTAFSIDEYHSQVAALMSLFRERYCLSYHFEYDRQRPSVCDYTGKVAAWVNGRFVRDLTPHQVRYIKALRAIVRKTDDLERRVALLRDWRLEGAEG